MKPKRTSAAEALGRQAQVGVRVTIVTLDSHLASATERAQHVLLREIPGLRLSLHAASEWDDPAALDRCKADIAQADIVFVTMMFMDDHIQAVLPALLARRDQCDAMVCCMSAAEVAKLTRMGRFDMSKPATGALALLKRLRGKSGAGGDGKTGTTASRSAGAQQLKMLRMLPRILRFVPGTAQDVRAYFLTLQYWLAGSDDNVANLVRLLIDRYAAGPRAALHGTLPARPPAEYPEVGVYHPRMKGRINASAAALPRLAHARGGTVGVLVMRSYLLAGNSQHYDGVIAALEARGLNVIPAFSSGLDARPAVEQFFMKDGRSTIDALVSLTGFSLVGGPAYNDARAAEELLAALDVPYVAAHPVEFQSLPQWATSERGLLPVESTIMVAIPELDGATGSMVIGGRGVGAEGRGQRRHRDGGLPVGVRVAAPPDGRAGRAGLLGRGAGQRRGPARARARRQRPALRPAGQRAPARGRRRARAARAPPGRDRTRLGPGAGQAAVRRRGVVHPRRALWQPVRRHPARLRL